MIPTVLAAGLLAGLFTRSWWPVAALALVWAAVVAVATTSDVPALLGAAGLGALNAAAAVAVGRGVRNVAHRSRS